MDRRSLLFILLMTLSFLGIRTWYDKKHQENLAKWKEQEAISGKSAPKNSIEEHKSNISSTNIYNKAAAISDLPLVYVSHNMTRPNNQPVLLSSEIIDEITQDESHKKQAYGIQIGSDLFALLSTNSTAVWPEKISLNSLQTQLPLSGNISLLKAYNNSYAIYSIGTSKSKNVVGFQGEKSTIGFWAVILNNENNADPESYEVIPVSFVNNVAVDQYGVPLSASSAIFVQGDAETTAHFYPLGTLSYDSINQKSSRRLSFFSEEKALSGKVTKISPQEIAIDATSNSSSAIEYYVLENEYQQLVFSTAGGALVEINLPFAGTRSSKSIVRPIAYDANITKESPHNAQFPLAPKVLNAENRPITPTLGGYYPLIRRSLLSDNSASETIIARVEPKYHSMMIRQSLQNSGAFDPIDRATIYKVVEHTAHSIQFVGEEKNGTIISKKYTFPENSDSYPYCIDLEISTRHNTGSSRDFLLTSGVPEIEWLSGANGASLGILSSKNENNSSTFERITLPEDRYLSKLHAPSWIMNSNGFFALIMKPISKNNQGALFEKASGLEAPSRLIELETTYSDFTEAQLPGYQAGLILDGQRANRIRMYAGPLDDIIFDKIDTASEKEFGTSFEFYNALSYQGWFTFISEPFAKILYFFMKQFHALVGSWGLSIIFATVLLRILLYPLNNWSMNSMRKMKEISPLVQAIQEKYKKDPSRAQKEMMALYREKGVNPFSGCLPLLIQMPFLIGMFDLLKSTFALRGASFIPGWITDLSAPDTLFQLPFNIPFLGNEFHLLPILLGGIMWIQQAMSSKMPQNQSDWTDQQRQQRAVGLMMTVMMTVMFYNFPSGLNIYWISSMALGILQQWWSVDHAINKKG